uniref:AAA+ ATPase domain-containing protein n=1 Tax=Ditylenchus dipsaci TaxID=166011 RepID=A0A915DVI4_9BILA
MYLAHVIMDFNKDLPKVKIHETAVEEIKEDLNFLARANSLLELAAEHYGSIGLQSGAKWGDWLKHVPISKPVKVPTIPENPNSNLRKAVEKLREEKRPFVQSVYHQEYVWLIRSSCCNTDAELELMWTHFLQAETTNDLDWTYSSWQRYQILRNSFYVLKKSRVYPGFLCCNCPVAMYRNMNSSDTDAYMVRTFRGFDKVFVDIDREEAAKNLGQCNKVFWDLYEKHKQHKPEIQMKEIAWQKLSMILSQAMPEAALLQKGSTVNNLSTLSSDLDLCLIVLNPENNTYDNNISFEVLGKTERLLKQSNAVRSVELIDARVTILKVELNYPYNHFAIDITCNCLIGIFNSHLLSYYSRLDERFPALAVLVKDQAKKVLVIDPRNGRLNSYAIILMLIHYLQCVVYPPILPNLMKLFPKMFGGLGDPKKLRYDCKLDLPKIPKNTRTLAELAYGFYNYYAQFDYESCGISIYDAKVFDRSCQTIYNQDYAFFLEEPYSKLTAAHNLKDRSLEEMVDAFGLARDAILKDLLGFTPVELLDDEERKDRECRPKVVDEVIFQDEVVAMLKKCVDGADLPNLLLHGPPGTGKTSTAVALCHQLFQTRESYIDRVLELNASDERGIDVVRHRIKDFSRRAVTRLNASKTKAATVALKVVILDEADAMTGSAQAALRRTMENETQTTRLRAICESEKVSIACGAVKELISVSGGDLRKSITLLQSLACSSGDTWISTENVRELSGYIPDEEIKKLVSSAKAGRIDCLTQSVKRFRTHGFSAYQVINQLTDVIVESTLLQAVHKAKIFEKIGECEKRLLDGADEFLQLLDVLAVVQTCFFHVDD